jgi:hypothetical protein
MNPIKPNVSSVSSQSSTTLAAYVQQTVASIDTVEAGLGSDPALAPKDRRRAVKLRKGGDKVVASLGNLAVQHQLESPALQVAVMLALLGRASALRPLADRLAAFAKHVSDAIFVSESQAWTMAMQYYALLRRRALADTELATALVPITQFLSYRHPSTKAPVGSPTKRQVAAARKAQQTLASVAGGKLADTNLLAPRTQPAPPDGAPPTTSGGGTPTARS